MGQVGSEDVRWVVSKITRVIIGGDCITSLNELENGTINDVIRGSYRTEEGTQKVEDFYDKITQSMDTLE